MSDDKPRLGHRAIIAYGRLAQEVASLNYLLRFARPAGTLGESGRRSLNDALRTANRLYCREPGMPKFRLLDPVDPLTAADVALLVVRLTTAGQEFEERYAHMAVAAAPDIPD